MPYVTSLERMARKEGHEEGRAEGHTEGRTEGRREGLLEAIELGLETKFGQRGRKLLPKIRAVLDVDLLRTLTRAIQTAESLDDVRKHLS